MGLEIEGIDRLIAKLGKLEGVKVLEEPMTASVVKLQAEMQVYPSEVPGSRYVRTGKLGQAWTIKIDRHADGLTGRVGNRRLYAPFVQSSQFQAKVHVGRWTTDAQALERLRPWIVERFQRRIRAALEGR